MRLWSIHPVYLDVKGLVALWREGLLAQQVLQGRTKGYKNHPQLARFKNTENSVGAITAYLKSVVDEADNRGYRFDRRKITDMKFNRKMSVTTGQLEYEFAHLMGKLKKRNPELYDRFTGIEKIEPHPLFNEISGIVESWEII
jgi:hypothetical protein